MRGRLVIVGSGETSPTMVKIHRMLLAEAGGGARAMLDTPFGFQTNADDLVGKIQEYFTDSVGVPVEPARWRRSDDPVADRERTLGLLHRASWVFAGPGSPSYALRHWRGTPVPAALLDVLDRGGTVVLGSAAAVTTGADALPVYEIYKAGDDPVWLPGLDLLGATTGIPAAVVPHFDNREGGRHDTRFCYLGEERLRLLEQRLPEGTGVLGVDEHTAVVIDAAAGTATVHGAGGMTLRHRGDAEVVPSGETVGLAEVAAMLAGTGHARHFAAAPTATAPAPSEEAAGDGDPTGAADGLDDGPSLRGTAAALRRRFEECLAGADPDGAVTACLDLEEAIHAWSRDTLQSDDVDRARRTLRSMIADLRDGLASGLQDSRTILGPVVGVVLDVRRNAREARDYATSDLIRDGLAAAGIVVRDTPDGVEWDVAPG